MDQAERVRAVEVLAADLLSYLPQPKQPSSTIPAESGLAKSRREPCTACKQRGRVTAPGRHCVRCPSLVGPAAPAPKFGDAVGHKGCFPCLVCEGFGWKLVPWRRDKPGWDAYAGVPVGSKGERPEWDAEQETGRQLKRVSQLLVLWEAVKPCPHGYNLDMQVCPSGCETLDVGWEERRRAMWRSGSFQELSHALRWLERHFPSRFSLFWRLRVYGQPVVLSEKMQQQLDETTLWVSKLMPSRIRVPRELRPQVYLDEAAGIKKESLWRGRTSGHGLQRAEREAMIRAQRAEGWKQERIAAFHSLTRERVSQILAAAPSATAA